MDATTAVKRAETATLMLLCPYCGAATAPGARCAACRGLLDPLSRQASQNAMGPWFVRDESLPFMPGCSYETLVGMVKRGKVTKRTVIRGPTTRQFWCTAERTPGVSHLLGACHNCRVDVQPTDSFCDECGAGFTVEPDRQHLGLGPVHLLPGQAAPEAIAGAGTVHEAPAARPAVRVAAKPAPAPPPDFSGLVQALRGKVRRQRWLLAVLTMFLLAAGGVLAWLLVPSDVVDRWLSGTVRTGAPAAAPKVIAPAPAATRDAVPASEPAGEPAAVPTPAEAPGPKREPDAPAPSPGGGRDTGGAPATEVTAAPAPVPNALALAGESRPDVVEEAGARLESVPDLRRAVERRAVQLRLRGFP